MRSKSRASWRQGLLAAGLMLSPWIYAETITPPPAPVAKSTVIVEEKPGFQLPFFGSKNAIPQYQGPTPDQAEIQRLAEELQRLINERDALEKRLFELQQAKIQPGASGLACPPSSHGALLSLYDPSINNPRLREAVVIRNLRAALLNLVVKLRATEKALSGQADKTRQLAAELAAMKHDPAILNDPSLVVPVVVEAPENGGSGKTQPEKAKEAFSYEPPKIKPDPRRENEAALRATIRQNPSDIEAYLRLADLYAGRQNLSQAEGVLTRLIARKPSHADAYYYLALVYLGQGKGLEATAALETYKRLNPSDQLRIRQLQAVLQPTGKH